MGTDYYTTVGPYILIDNPPVNRTRGLRTCPNTKCQNHKRRSYGEKFCRCCGTEIGKVFFDVTEPKEWGEFVLNNEGYDLIFDDFRAPLDGNLFIPELENKLVVVVYGMKFLKRESELDNFGYLDMSTVDTQLEIAAFQTHYEKELALIKAEWGDEAVKVKWGVISWICC